MIERDDDLVGTKDIFFVERSLEDKAQRSCNLCLSSSTGEVRVYTSELVCPQVQERSKLTLVSFVGHACFGGVEEQHCGVGGRIWQLSSN
jgi:hypothetical protein